MMVLWSGGRQSVNHHACYRFPPAWLNSACCRRSPVLSARACRRASLANLTQASSVITTGTIWVAACTRGTVGHAQQRHVHHWHAQQRIVWCMMAVQEGACSWQRNHGMHHQPLMPGATLQHSAVAGAKAAPATLFGQGVCATPGCHTAGSNTGCQTGGVLHRPATLSNPNRDLAQALRKQRLKMARHSH